MKSAKNCVRLLQLAVVALLLIPGSLSAQATPSALDHVLAMMDRAAKEFHTLSADVEHVKYTDVVADTSSEKGRMFVKRDDKMRIDFTSPDQRTILRTGDSLFVYTPKINRVEEYNLGKNRELVDQYVLLGFGSKADDLRKSYTIELKDEEELDGKKTALLDLTPKSETVRKQVTKIQVWIDEASWLPIQQKFYEAGSADYLIFHYSNVKENLKLDDSQFKQNWPKNLKSVRPGS